VTKVAIAAAVALIVSLFAAWVARAEEGRSALADADAALASGETALAIFHARAAAEARCPGCSAPAEGYERLAQIARDAEARADDETALSAWRAVRAASLASAVLGQATRERTRADEELARLGARVARSAAAAGGPSSPAASELRLRETLAVTPNPSGTTYGLVGGGFALFLVGAVRFSRRVGRRVVDLAIVGVGSALAGIGALFF
jgi:hypothetical protein